MRSAMLTPPERLRPNNGVTRIDYNDGAYVVRPAGVRFDPTVTPGERRFDHALEQLFVAAVWIGGIVGGWWVLFEGSKIIYSFALHHPFGL